MATKPQLLTTKEAAQILRASVTTVHRMRKRGELRGFAKRGMGRITVESIEEYIGAEIVWPLPDEGESVGHERVGAESDVPSRVPSEPAGSPPPTPTPEDPHA